MDKYERVMHNEIVIRDVRLNRYRELEPMEKSEKVIGFLRLGGFK